jgi:ELWxxDGT repeat protein
LSGNSGVYGSNLTPQGTVLLLDNASLIQQAYGDYATWNGLALVMMADETGQSVWTTDGTPEGTQFVADIPPGALEHRSFSRLDGDRLILIGSSGSPEVPQIVTIDL